jgi:hypothetical protein
LSEVIFLVQRDVWEKSQGFDRVHKGDKILAHKMAERKKEQLRQQEVQRKMRELEARRIEEKRKNSVRARMKKALVGPQGLLRKDLFAPFKRRR